MTIKPLFTKEEWLTLSPEAKEKRIIEARENDGETKPQTREELEKMVDEIIAQAN